MKQKHQFKNIVAETLLIPLYMRAKESRRKEKAILRDDLAEQLTACIEYDYSRFDGARLSEVGCVVRGWYFDNAVRRFAASHPSPIVVNIGCGLDTRFQRLGGCGGAVFYELDLPEVIELRRSLIPESENDIYLAASLLEYGWMDELRQKHAGSDFIFIIEGVLMYFYEKQVRQFLSRLAERFEGGEIWFDVCGTMMSKHKIKPDSLKNHEAQIRSGISNGHEVEQWEPRLQLIEQANYMKFFRRRWGIFGMLIGLFPRFCYKFSSLLGYKISEKND